MGALALFGDALASQRLRAFPLYTLGLRARPLNLPPLHPLALDVLPGLGCVNLGPLANLRALTGLGPLADLRALTNLGALRLGSSIPGPAVVRLRIRLLLVRLLLCLLFCLHRPIPFARRGGCAESGREQCAERRGEQDAIAEDGVHGRPSIAGKHVRLP